MAGAVTWTSAGSMFKPILGQLNIAGVIILNSGDNGLDELQEDEEVLVHGGRHTTFLQRLDDSEHCWRVLTRVNRSYNNKLKGLA